MEEVQSVKGTDGCKKYYGIENDSQMAITVDDQIVEPHGMISDGKAYVQYEVVRDYINSRFTGMPMRTSFCTHCRQIL